MEEKGEKTSKAPAITRAVAALRLLGASDTPLGVQAIARELGIVPSTCLYVLRALVDEELVAFDPATKRYALDAGILTLARQWLRRSQFADLAQPLLERMSQRFGVTTIGVQLSNPGHMVVVALAQSGQGLQLSAQVGSRFPLFISATGRVMAAHGNYPRPTLEARFRELRWDNPPLLETWLEEIEMARQQGFAIDDGNYINGLTVVSAPVWKAPGRPTHALVAIGIGGALQRLGLTELTQDLVDTSRTLSEQLGSPSPQ